MRLTSSSNVDITGLTAPNPARNQSIFICNVNTNNANITFKTRSASSLAANRFGLGSDRLLNKDDGLVLTYDTISSVWRSSAHNL